MKTRFMEILQMHCDNYGASIEAALNKRCRNEPVPLVKAKAIKDYAEEYPHTTLKVIGNWLGGMDHSSVSHLKSNADTYKYLPRIIDFSGFVNFSYPTLFTYKLNG